VDIILWLVFVFIPLAVPPFNFATAVIIILKHATTLHPFGFSAQSALAQAELDYQKLNISLKIAQHFTPPQEYSVQNFVDFIMGVSVSLLLHYQDDI
jgi:hypothetical protein